VILSFLLISIDHAHQHLAALRAGLAMVVYPLQYAASLPVQMVDGTARILATHRSLLTENEHLRAENLLLQAKALRMESLARENERLRQLLDSSAARTDEIAVADILTVDSNPAQHQLVIDKGSRNHIYVGQPIADARGVLGQVVQVTPYTSTVLLVSDERHAIAVELNRTGLRAVAVGTGQAEQLLLSFVPTNADVKVGDLVVSSGLDKRFPAGYPVGEVTEVSTEPGDPFAHIKVKPSAQIGHSREVLLVWPQRRATEAPDTP